MEENSMIDQNSGIVDMMTALSTQGLRSNPYPLPHPAAGRIASRPVPYNLRTSPFSSHLQQHQYSPPNHSGFNSMLLQTGTGLSFFPPATTASMQLPGSPAQESSGGTLPQNTVVLRKQPASNQGSPIPPSSPILEEDSTTEQFKPNSYFNAPIGPIGMNPATAFNSFPSPHHQPTSFPMACGMGYHNSSSVCHSPIYTAQDSMYSNGTSHLTLPAMWNCHTLSGMNIQGNSVTKLTLDTPRYKLTPERAIPLIKWFEEHKEHPYPTRHEKMLLCQSTQLTYVQVSTWFANARRRMKKANSEEEENRSNHSSSDEYTSQNSLDSPPQS